MSDAQPPPETTGPSAKAIGKRAVTNNTADLQTSHSESVVQAAPPQTAVHSPPKTGMQTRKRVMPARSRRGGPGVGGCDVDIMILETRKRRLENEPLLPSTTKFILTTNHALVPSSSKEGLDDAELNTLAYSRYFDRSEVQEACRTQATIQTPEFTALPDDALVGGRFRPRNTDEELVDTSDAAYEKRHRKYETFEKRQRLREKEKLKYEQYKLKERIEQLRAMETSAFLALPASNFSEPSGVTEPEDEFDEADTGLAELPGAHVNGAAAYNEGERRRREMLEIAESLEERYRVLLPPDRKWQEKKEKLERAKRERASTSVSVDPQPRLRTATAEPDELEEEDLVHPGHTAISAPVPSTSHRQESDGESEVNFAARNQEKSKKLKLRIPPRPPASSSVEQSTVLPSFLSAPVKKVHHNATIKHPFLIHGQNGRHTIRSSDGRFLPKAKRQAAAAGESISVPPRKKPRTSSVDIGNSPTKSDTSVSSRRHQPCILLLSAMRNAETQNARKTHRHVTAFGVRVPTQIEEVRDFELPAWLLDESEDSDDEQGEADIHHENDLSDDDPPLGNEELDENMMDDFPQIATLESED